MNRRIIKVVGAQDVQIRGRHGIIATREFDGKCTERLIGVGKRRRAPILGDGVDKGIGFCGAGELVIDLSTEVVGVGLRSVTTVAFHRDHGGQHLTLRSTER